jgi:hypothetical protein
MSKKEKKPNRNTFVKGLLRRGSFHWKPRNEALKLARVERGKYKCAMCEELFGPREVILDHIDPVVDPKQGFVGFDTYIERLYCDVEGFQVLCNACSDAKTLVEDEMRKHYKTQRDELPDLKKSKKKKKMSQEEVEN